MNFSQLLKDNMGFIQIAIIIVIIILIIYFGKKMMQEGFLGSSVFTQMAIAPCDSTMPVMSESQNLQMVKPADEYKDTTSPVTFTVGQELNAQDLLPTSEVASEFNIGLGGNVDLAAKNFLTSGFSIGIDTISGSNKLANYDIRQMPFIPVNLNATPFNQSTAMSNSYLQKKLEIGN